MRKKKKQNETKRNEDHQRLISVGRASAPYLCIGYVYVFSRHVRQVITAYAVSGVRTVLMLST